MTPDEVPLQPMYTDAAGADAAVLAFLGSL